MKTSLMTCAAKFLALLIVVGMLLQVSAVADESSVLASSSENTAIEKLAVRTSSSEDKPLAKVHPLMPVIELATEELRAAEQLIDEYSCLLIKRERVDGKLTSRQYLNVKMRHRKFEDGKLVTPLGVYVKFLKPSDLAGREVLYVEGERGGNVLARRGGSFLPNLTVELRVDGRMAMQDNLHPITHMGFRNLVSDLIENMRGDLPYDDVDVTFYDNAKLGDRDCQHVQVTHAVKAEHFDYHIARIFVDKELRLPVYFASYDWPDKEGGQPVLKQEYIFTNLNLKPGFTDADFRPDNPQYAFSEVDPNPEASISANQ